jgi:hypothetical protein
MKTTATAYQLLFERALKNLELVLKENAFYSNQKNRRRKQIPYKRLIVKAA